ncbi:MAG: hypothetical protein KBG84_14930 [Planctomycetes bacterium]|nr:hypothetical protein [Planctomycetota bacterium]
MFKELATFVFFFAGGNAGLALCSFCLEKLEHSQRFWSELVVWVSGENPLSTTRRPIGTRTEKLEQRFRHTARGDPNLDGAWRCFQARCFDCQRNFLLLRGKFPFRQGTQPDAKATRTVTYARLHNNQVPAFGEKVRTVHARRKRLPETGPTLVLVKTQWTFCIGFQNESGKGRCRHHGTLFIKLTPAKENLDRAVGSQREPSIARALWNQLLLIQVDRRNEVGDGLSVRPYHCAEINHAIDRLGWNGPERAQLPILTGIGRVHSQIAFWFENVVEPLAAFIGKWAADPPLGYVTEFRSLLVRFCKVTSRAKRLRVLEENWVSTVALQLICKRFEFALERLVHSKFIGQHSFECKVCAELLFLWALGSL